MNMLQKKWTKYLAGTIGAVIAGFILMVGATKIVYPAISELVGLSVAQSATVWNSVADAAKGDGLSSGILGQSPYLWNGVSFDRQRGSITNGALVDVTRIVGTLTPSDAFANPTTINDVWALNSVFNGTTWDRWRAGVSLTQGGTPTGALFNTQTTGGAATAVTVTLTAVAGQRTHIYSLEARCNTATETSNVLISDGGTTIWSSGPLAVTAAAPQYSKYWTTGLTGATNSQVLVTLAACATGTGTLIVQADKF